MVMAGFAAIFPFKLPAAEGQPPLPETVTSFGAVTHDGWLYTFGGHKGERHDYSAEMVSGSFNRLKITDGRAWEPLPEAAPGQGLPLVAYAGGLYRVGGMAARNHAGAKQDLYSLPLVQRFDVRGRRWESIAPCPPRVQAMTRWFWLASFTWLEVGSFRAAPINPSGRPAPWCWI